MADLIIAAQFGLLLLVFFEDVAFENLPLAMVLLGALSLSVGIIAWPMSPSIDAEGNEHGV